MNKIKTSLKDGEINNKTPNNTVNHTLNKIFSKQLSSFSCNKKDMENNKAKSCTNKYIQHNMANIIPKFRYCVLTIIEKHWLQRIKDTGRKIRREKREIKEKRGRGKDSHVYCYKSLCILTLMGQTMCVRDLGKGG